MKLPLPNKIQHVIPDGDRDKYYFSRDEFLEHIAECITRILIDIYGDFSTSTIQIVEGATHYNVHHENYNMTELTFHLDFVSGRVEVRHWGKEEFFGGQIEKMTIWFVWNKEKVTFS